MKSEKKETSNCDFCLHPWVKKFELIYWSYPDSGKANTKENPIWCYILLKKKGNLFVSQDAGRLLYIGQNEWTHVNCALWSAEVFEDDDGSLKNVHMAVIRGKQLVRTCGWMSWKRLPFSFQMFFLRLSAALLMFLLVPSEWFSQQQILVCIVGRLLFWPLEDGCKRNRK